LDWTCTITQRANCWSVAFLPVQLGIVILIEQPEPDHRRRHPGAGRELGSNSLCCNFNGLETASPTVALPLRESSDRHPVVNAYIC
jgi:hypothetical protein